MGTELFYAIVCGCISFSTFVIGIRIGKRMKDSETRNAFVAGWQAHSLSESMTEFFKKMKAAQARAEADTPSEESKNDAPTPPTE